MESKIIKMYIGEFLLISSGSGFLLLFFVYKLSEMFIFYG